MSNRQPQQVKSAQNEACFSSLTMESFFITPNVKISLYVVANKDLR